MHIVASFEHSTKLELAITELEQMGIAKNKICAIPLTRMRQEKQLFDNIHRADGQSMFDLGCILGTILMLFGVIWGFLWTWGPILWGLIGFFGGFGIGFALKYFFYVRNNKHEIIKGSAGEVFLIVNCQENQVHAVEQILNAHLALGIGRKMPQVSIPSP